MKHTFVKQARRTGIALAAGAFAVLAMGVAQAATFASAEISIAPRGEEAGSLVCKWRETGLGPTQVVYYTCGAGAVGVLKACVYKNRVIFNSPSKLEAFSNVIGGEHGGAEPFLSQKNGQINASTTTPIPQLEAATELCTEPSVESVVAVRWCNATLTDATNNLMGASVGELYLEFYPGVGTVPPCTP